MSAMFTEEFQSQLKQKKYIFLKLLESVLQKRLFFKKKYKTIQKFIDFFREDDEKSLLFKKKYKTIQKLINFFHENDAKRENLKS